MLSDSQLFSRVFITWVVLGGRFPEAESSRGLPMLLLAWELTEVVRYSYYALGVVGAVPGILTWARYTLFLGLYPLGVTGELLCAFACLSRIQR